jgi:hypothetical protein
VGGNETGRWIARSDLLALVQRDVQRDVQVAGDEPPADVLRRDPHLHVPMTGAASPPLDVHTYRVRFQRWEEGTGPRLTGIQEFVQVLETLDAPARAATVSGERTSYTFLLDAPATRVLACVAVDPPSTP